MLILILVLVQAGGLLSLEYSAEPVGLDQPDLQLLPSAATRQQLQPVASLGSFLVFLLVFPPSRLCRHQIVD